MGNLFSGAKVQKISDIANFFAKKFCHVRKKAYLCTLNYIWIIMFIDEEDTRTPDEILKDTEFPDDYDAFEDENLEMIP